ncbi:MAG: hypothetical protein A3I79_00700 [Gemmatimonadetes bacterium RIFCSPLOWO2_02_FULL_71_11]|nr:MAG: hypothetical protein A3I79_00700 [Gemmatimonadetes bacterium RIFCSPLOWO2_02_FULL_71_11]
MPVGEAIALLIPMTSPLRFTSGPPELPGLIAASVWMKSWIAYRAFSSTSPSSRRPLALMMPAVTVKVKPSGLPTASTQSPIRTWSELPKTIVGRLAASILMTATSVLGSRPTTRAVKTRLSSSRTVTWSASATTWLLVRM